MTTALLGTTRRPLGEESEHGRAWAASLPAHGDTAVRVLDLAAAHRVVALVGDDPPTAPPAQVAPDQHLPAAPDAAVAVFDELCARPEPSLIAYWLEQCVVHRKTVAPVHWTFVARAAARSTRYDRATVGRALGASGRWFLRQNPDWRRLAADAVAGALTPPPPPTSASVRRAAMPPMADLAADPDLILAQLDPWPAEVAAAAWAVLGLAELGPRLTGFASEVGLRMPPELYPRLSEAAAFYLEAPEASPAQRRAIRHGFATLEHAAFARARIAAAFAGCSDDQATIRFDRVEIPHV